MKVIILTEELRQEYTSKFFAEHQMTTEPIEDRFGNWVLPEPTAKQVGLDYIGLELEVVDFYPKIIEDYEQESESMMMYRIEQQMKDDVSAPLPDDVVNRIKRDYLVTDNEIEQPVIEDYKEPFMFRGLLLFIVSQTLNKVLIKVGWVYSFFSIWFKHGWKATDKWLFDCAYSDDQRGNVFLKGALNDFCTTSKKEVFGDPDDTISFAIAIVNRLRTFKPIGRGLYNVLEKIDPKNGGHAEKAIKANYKQAKEKVELITYIEQNYPKIK
jgi:hypothetical protein